MMRFGCALIALGFVLGVAGLVAVGYWLFDPWAAREVRREAITIGKPIITDVLTVQPGGRTALKVVATVHAPHAVYQDNGKWEDAAHDKRPVRPEPYELKYRFPVVYRVLDEEKEEIASVASLFTYGEHSHDPADVATVGVHGGTAKVGVQFPTFTAPPSGKVRVELTLFPDEGNGATLEGPTLLLVDNVPQSPERTALTIAAPFVGLGLLLIGFLVFCVGVIGWLYRQIVGPPRRVAY